MTPRPVSMTIRFDDGQELVVPNPTVELSAPCPHDGPIYNDGFAFRVRRTDFLQVRASGEIAKTEVRLAQLTRGGVFVLMPPRDVEKGAV